MKKLLSVLLLIVLLCGCAQETEPDSVLSRYFSLLKSADFEKADELVICDDASLNKLIPDTEFNRELFSLISFEVWSTGEIKNNTVTKEVLIKQASIKKIYTDTLKKYSEATADFKNFDEDFDAVLLKALKENQTPVEFVVNVEMRCENEKWMIVLDKKLLNAIFGGYLEAIIDSAETK